MNRENNVVILRHVKDDYLNTSLEDLVAATKNILARGVLTDGDVLVLGCYLDAVGNHDLLDEQLAAKTKRAALHYLMGVLETDDRGGARLAELVDKSWALGDIARQLDE